MAAAFYRTEHDPEALQLDWRAWYLSSLDERGQIVSWLPKLANDLGPEDLCANILRSNVHEEYEDGRA